MSAAVRDLPMNHTRLVAVAFACAAGLPLSACRSTAQPDREPPPARLPVVDLHGPLWRARDAWTIEAQPFLVGPAQQAADAGGAVARVSSALMLDDRSFLVSDAEHRRLQHLSRTAAPLAAVDARGGADAFSGIAGTRVFPGTSPQEVIVADDGNASAHRVAVDGSHVDAVALTGGGTLEGVFGDGTWLVQLLARSASRAPGPLTHRLLLWRYARDGRPINRLATVGLPGRFVNDNGRVSDYLLPFVAQPSVAASSDRLWIVTGPDASVDGYRLDGSGVATLRWPLPRRSSADGRTVLERVQARMSAADRAVFDRLPVPAWLPAYAQILADDEGTLWLERYRLRAERDGPSTWDVVDPAAGWLGSLEVPGGVEVLAIRKRVLLARTGDSPLGQQLRVYRILRP
jgi:hypothetical protein